jgi:large subunit ribosomal protein L4
MLKVDLYSFEGKKKENATLPKEYDVKPNLILLSQAIHVFESREHLGLARTKTRSEVAISTKKIYRQKGTGGARHGAKSAPIFVGGGTAHGPKGVKRILRLSESQKLSSRF